MSVVFLINTNIQEIVNKISGINAALFFDQIVFVFPHKSERNNCKEKMQFLR